MDSGRNIPRAPPLQRRPAPPPRVMSRPDHPTQFYHVNSSKGHRLHHQHHLTMHRGLPPPPLKSQQTSIDRNRLRPPPTSQQAPPAPTPPVETPVPWQNEDDEAILVAGLHHRLVNDEPLELRHIYKLSRKLFNNQDKSNEDLSDIYEELKEFSQLLERGVERRVEALRQTENDRDQMITIENELRLAQETHLKELETADTLTRARRQYRQTLQERINIAEFAATRYPSVEKSRSKIKEIYGSLDQEEANMALIRDTFNRRPQIWQNIKGRLLDYLTAMVEGREEEFLTAPENRSASPRATGAERGIAPPTPLVQPPSPSPSTNSVLSVPPGEEDGRMGERPSKNSDGVTFKVLQQWLGKTEEKPHPDENEKERLCVETGLTLTSNRKRNWQEADYIQGG